MPPFRLFAKGGKMRLFARLVSCLLPVLLALVLAHASVLAAERPYRNDDLASSAVRLEKKLNDDSADLRAHSSLTDLRNQANAAVAREDYAAAVRAFCLAISFMMRELRQQRRKKA